MIGLGLGPPFGQPAGGFSSPEYQTVYDAYVGTIPDAAQADAQNTMAKFLVDTSVWAKLDVLQIYANGDSPNMSLNWKNPGTIDATAVNLPTFEPWEGVTHVAATSYINSNFIPATHGVNYTLNDASLGVYIRTNIAEDNYDFGARGTAVQYSLIQARNSSNDTEFRVNDSATISKANADSRGLFIIQRTSATTKEVFRNNVSLGSGNVASNDLPDRAVFVLCNNNNGTAVGFSTKQVSLFFAGASLTPQNRADLQTAFETYMDFLGKGVIT